MFLEIIVASVGTSEELSWNRMVSAPATSLVSKQDVMVLLGF